ncbi:IclR family transcriptional regulator [Gulosibacter chungangensis]|uniref:IclR family transcriptional regulator n=1 Tax=Gulosibacter chungangensis TaxID=979746 RepID=A0A7J5BBI5_9MICO|nr:IclR family transcriptional regulator [Gulosibacter chungangensis]KAB1643407.1 IclR family transcriptional regulator [Gulosibacter chungangensis]
MKPIRALSNADEVVRLLGSEGDMSPAEIAERLDIPRPSVYRLLDGLESIGLTESVPGSRARLNLRWLHLADQARESMVEWAGARELLSELVERTSQTAYLTVLRGHEAVCLEWEQGRAVGVLLLKPGRSLPLYAGAAGRTCLAFGVNVEEYLDTVTERRAYTADTLTSDAALRADVEATRRRGYVFSDEDVTDGIAAIGVPIRGSRGQLLGALSVSGIKVEYLAKRDAYLEALLDVAGRLASLNEAAIQ